MLDEIHTRLITSNLIYNEMQNFFSNFQLKQYEGTYLESGDYIIRLAFEMTWLQKKIEPQMYLIRNYL